MRKFTKVMLVAAGVFTSVGIGLTVGGAVMGAGTQDVETVKKQVVNTLSNAGIRHIDGWDIDWNDYDDYDDGDGVYSELAEESDGEVKTYHADALENLKLDLQYDELYMEPHDGKDILVEVEGDSDGNVSVKSGEKTLHLTSRKKEHRVIRLYYPENTVFQEVDIEVSAGSVSLDGNLETKELEVSVGAGEFIGNGIVTAKNTSFEVGAGRLEVNDLSASEIDGECGMGEMVLVLTGNEKDYSYQLDCAVGNIDIGSDSYSGLASSKNVRNENASGKLDLECGMGNISVEFRGVK